MGWLWVSYSLLFIGAHLCFLKSRYLQTFIYLIGDVDPRPVPEEDLRFAQQCIEFFVGRIIHLSPGEIKIPICFHLILHACDQCRRNMCHYGILSVFPYENSCRCMKRFWNAGNCKAEQFRNRLLECDTYLFARDENDRIIRDADGTPARGWGPHEGGTKNLPADGVKYHFQAGGKYKKLIFSTFMLSPAFADSFCLVKSPALVARDRKCILQITDIRARESDGMVYVFGHVYKSKRSLYDLPEESKWRGVYAFSGKSSTVSAFPADSIREKLYVIPRFASFHNSMRILSRAEIGAKYENVPEWVGIKLRHAHVDPSKSDSKSLY